MLKQVLLGFTFCLLFFILTVCQTKPVDDTDRINESLVSTKNSQEPVIINENDLVEIPIESVEGITEEDAKNLCREIIGDIADGSSLIIEHNTGFKLAYRCDAAIEYEGVQYYVINMTWLVDDNHWSSIGDLMVSANGNEIFYGIQHSDGTFSIGKSIWSSFKTP